MKDETYEKTAQIGGIIFSRYHDFFYPAGNQRVCGGGQNAYIDHANVLYQIPEEEI